VGILRIRACWLRYKVYIPVITRPADFPVTEPSVRGYFSQIPYGLQSIDTPADDGQPNQTLVAERYFTFSQTTDIPSGKYSIQVHALNSGSYYIDYRGYDSTGTTNDSSLKTGTLLAGQSVTAAVNHSAEAVARPTAELTLSEYSIKKKPRTTYSDAKVTLKGHLKTYNKSQIELRDQFVLSVGGISGAKAVLYASDFKVTRSKKETLYLYSKNHIELILSSTGEFKLEMKNFDLSGLDKDQISYVTLKVDGNFADKRLQIECRKNACKLPPPNGHCHFDLEDEE